MTALLEEIASTPDAVRAFDLSPARPVAEAFARRGRLMVVGEGSSRIFPARRAIAAWRRRGIAGEVATEGCRQALGYPLEGWVVLALSRSGETREVLDLVAALRARGHPEVFEGGRDAERAFPATRSVVREALLVEACLDGAGLLDRLPRIAGGIAAALEMRPREKDVSRVADARRVLVVGPDDGVAEELALKCMEIARRPAAFLEGNLLLHGAHATLRKGDVVLAVARPPEDKDRMRERVERCGARLVSLAAPEGADEFARLAAGWRLLAAAGLARGVDLDGADLRV